VLLWELYTGQHAFKGVPRALLGHAVARSHQRPEFPAHCPFAYQMLACRCWESDPDIRPTFEEILGACCWAGLGWAGLGWAGLGWAGLGFCCGYRRQRAVLQSLDWAVGPCLAACPR
jgi:hypothetical protein